MLKSVAPDIYEHQLLWAPVLAKMATYREVFVDDVYDLMDLERMCAAIEHESAQKGYQDFAISQESKNHRK